MSTIMFNASHDEFELMRTIATRYEAPTGEINRLGLLMDIEACHCNGCPLDLAGLAAAGSTDLTHDIIGIRSHLNRATGKIEGTFRPRFCAK